MNAFLWVILAVTALDVFMRLVHIGQSTLPERTWPQFVCDLFANAALMGWAIFLLVSA